jgi:hypothetical protein
VVDIPLLRLFCIRAVVHWNGNPALAGDGWTSRDTASGKNHSDRLTHR